MPYTRRRFLRDAGLSMAGTAIAPLYRTGASRRVAASDTVVIGLVGARNMGFGNLRNHLKQPGVVCGGLCDVDADVLDQRAADVEALTGQRPRLYRDFRALLDEADVDAVIIGTPDHWHCLQTVYACEAGKDVYVEKPLANSIAEGDLMVRAARHYGRVVQVGQQQRSGQHWKDVVDFVRSGALGDIRQVKVWADFHYGQGGPRVPNETPPPHVDFDLWLGPAPQQPFNPSRFHSSWRFQWDFGGGLLTDWGVHLLDIALWAMDVREAPRSVAAVGGLYTHADRAIETPDTLHVLYDMESYALTWEHAGGIETGPYDRHYGLAFVGSDGTLLVNRSGWEVRPETRDGGPAMEAVPFRASTGSHHELHAADFVSAVRERRDPACPIEAGRDAAFFAHLGNIAYRTGARVVWDEARRGFVGEPAADALVTPTYRGPWSWPTV